MKTVLTGLVLAGALSACQDLEVTNTNEPDRDRALSNPGDVEALIASSWRNIWNQEMNDASNYNPMPLVADIMTGTYANEGALEMSSEPRVPINNSTLGDFHTSGPLRDNWEDWYETLSNANEGLFAIQDGLEIRTADPGEPVLDHTHRAKTWATWVSGMALAHIALNFDKGWVITPGTDVSDPYNVPLRPYQEVMDSAIVILEQAIALAEQQEFVTPATWVHKTPISNNELVRIIHGFIARFLVLNARTREDRTTQVDWDKVLFHLDRAITSDFAPTMESGFLVSNHLNRHQLNTSTFSTRADHYLIGPADTSGRYQAWMAKPIAERDTFLIATPDRRVTGSTPTSNGTIFRYRANEIMNPQRGIYHRSRYQWYGSQGRAASGTWPLLSVKEMRLLRAEALYYQGDLDGAAAILNETRVPAGLAPATAAGVPQSTGCVPRLANGDCADLFHAIVYERTIELGGNGSMFGWWDSRGFDRLTEGTFLSLPIPARELITIRQPVYSFGGVGGQHAAGRCTTATLNCLP